jgi:hypothetical protein
MGKVSLQPTSTTSQELEKKSTNMYYFALCLWKSFSLQPTLTPSQWLENGPFAMKFLSQDKLHVHEYCAKIQAQKAYTK